QYLRKTLDISPINSKVQLCSGRGTFGTEEAKGHGTAGLHQPFATASLRAGSGGGGSARGGQRLRGAVLAVPRPGGLVCAWDGARPRPRRGPCPRGVHVSAPSAARNR